MLKIQDIHIPEGPELLCHFQRCLSPLLLTKKLVVIGSTFVVLWGCLDFDVSITHHPIFITHYSKMMRPTEMQLVWICFQVLFLSHSILTFFSNEIQKLKTSFRCFWVIETELWWYFCNFAKLSGPTHMLSPICGSAIMPSQWLQHYSFLASIVVVFERWYCSQKSIASVYLFFLSSFLHIYCYFSWNTIFL